MQTMFYGTARATAGELVGIRPRSTSSSSPKTQRSGSSPCPSRGALMHMIGRGSGDRDRGCDVADERSPRCPKASARDASELGSASVPIGFGGSIDEQIPALLAA